MLMQRIILAVLVLNTLAIAALAYIGYNHFDVGAQAEVGSGAEASTPPKKRALKASEYRFFPIQKIIVSLPGEEREHYFIVDLVLQADLETDEKKLQQIDPMVRNSVVAYMSSLTFAELRGLSIPELQTRLENVLMEDFGNRLVTQPFTHVLVSKLVVQ